MKHAIVALLCALACAACTLPRRSVDNPEDVPHDLVLLVGRISLNRALPPPHGAIDVMDAVHSAWIRASETPLPFLETHPTSANKDDLLVKWGELFRVPYPRYPKIFISGIYGFQSDPHLQQPLAFPVTGMIRSRPNARALYLGHIHLTLDSFYNLEGVRVTDEFTRDAKEFGLAGLERSLFVPERWRD